MDGIVIETPRLRIRPHRLADFSSLMAMWQDETVIRFTVRQPVEREDGWQRMLRYAGHWALLGHGMMRVEARDDGRLIGEVGLIEAHRGIGPDFDRALEAAWALLQPAHGLGLAREAVEAMFGWAAERFGAARVVCLIDPRNAASLRLAGRLGFEATGETHYHGDRVRLFERYLPKAGEAG